MDEHRHAIEAPTTSFADFAFPLLDDGFDPDEDEASLLSPGHHDEPEEEELL